MYNKLMGLDVGDKRVGIAVSDALMMTAQPYDTYFRVGIKKDTEYFTALIKKLGITGIVAGMPKNMDGTLGGQSEKTRRFTETVAKAAGLPYYYVDERLTSVIAERITAGSGLGTKEKRAALDRIAAAEILQQYMDSIRRKGDSDNE